MEDVATLHPREGLQAEADRLQVGRGGECGPSEGTQDPPEALQGTAPSPRALQTQAVNLCLRSLRTQSRN